MGYCGRSNSMVQLHGNQRRLEASKVALNLRVPKQEYLEKDFLFYSQLNVAKYSPTAQWQGGKEGSREKSDILFVFMRLAKPWIAALW
jgi:hypothetical protein